jgi:hypothetical protein
MKRRGRGAGVSEAKAEREPAAEILSEAKDAFHRGSELLRHLRARATRTGIVIPSAGFLGARNLLARAHSKSRSLAMLGMTTASV